MADKTKLYVFFTWDVSLKIWEEKGLFERETRFYQTLAKHGIDITFLSWGGKEEEALAKTLAPDIKTLSIYNHIPRPQNKALRALCSLAMPFALRAELKKADILKTNQIWGGWVAILAKWLINKPLIARCGFELYDFTCKQNHSWLRKIFIWWLSKLTYGNADRINVATQKDKDFIEKTFSVKNDKIHIHPNWIDTDIFTPQKQEQKQSHVLYVGRLSKQKNLSTLFEALKDTNLTLDLYGDGEERLELEMLADFLGVSVNFKGAVTNAQLPEIYNQYPVFVLPSHYEGNPKSLLEAMSCGASVVGADTAGINTVITNQENGLLCAPTAEELKKAIQTLIGDEKLKTRLGKSARAFILETHKLDKLIDKELAWLEFFKERKNEF
jgi:glycosyltransferase involved in cell wall biosynthesis